MHNREMNKKRSRNNTKKIKKFIDKLFYQIFLSTLLLLFLVLCSNNDAIKKVINNSMNKQISFTKIAYNLTNLFPSFIEPIGEVTVYNSIIYDNVTFDKGTNKVINYSFNGVINLCDSVVMKIYKNENGLYEVHTVNKDGYTYIYKNLESVDVNIYSYLKNETIIGSSSYDSLNNYYKFELVIEKDNMRYNFYEMAED